MAKRDKLAGLINEISKQADITDDVIKQNIVVSQELKDLIPPLAYDERQQLEENILAEGCREPIILWQQGNIYWLIDGHNRYEICTRLGIPFRITLKNFTSEDDVKNWMITNQLGRRNLTPEQQSYLRGKRYQIEKKTHGGTRNDVADNKKTSEKLAEEYRVSPKTILRDEQFARGLDKIDEIQPGSKQDVLTGKTKISKDIVQRIARTDAPLDHGSGKQKLETLLHQLKLESGINEENPINIQPLKKALSKADNRVRLMIKGDWLIDNNLSDWWQDEYGQEEPPDPNAHYYLSMKEVIKLGLIK